MQFPPPSFFKGAPWEPKWAGSWLPPSCVAGSLQQDVSAIPSALRKRPLQSWEVTTRVAPGTESCMVEGATASSSTSAASCQTEDAVSWVSSPSAPSTSQCQESQNAHRQERCPLSGILTGISNPVAARSMKDCNCAQHVHILQFVLELRICQWPGRDSIVAKTSTIVTEEQCLVVTRIPVNSTSQDCCDNAKERPSCLRHAFTHTLRHSKVLPVIHVEADVVTDSKADMGGLSA